MMTSNCSNDIFKKLFLIYEFEITVRSDNENTNIVG